MVTRWCVLVSTVMVAWLIALPTGTYGEEAKAEVPKPAAQAVAPTSYPDTVAPGGSRRKWTGPAVRVRFEQAAKEDGVKGTVQYLHPDAKQRPKFGALDLPAEVSFAVNPPKTEKKDAYEYRLVFVVPTTGGTTMLYARLLVYRETEFTQNSIVKVEITDEIAQAVASGEVQIIKVKDPQIQADLAKQAVPGVPADAKAARKGKELVIPGVGPEEILSLTIGNRAFGS